MFSDLALIVIWRKNWCRSTENAEDANTLLVDTDLLERIDQQWTSFSLQVIVYVNLFQLLTFLSVWVMNETDFSFRLRITYVARCTSIIILITIIRCAYVNLQFHARLFCFNSLPTIQQTIVDGPCRFNLRNMLTTYPVKAAAGAIGNQSGILMTESNVKVHRIAHTAIDRRLCCRSNKFWREITPGQVFDRMTMQ